MGTDYSISQLDDINTIGQYKRCLEEGYSKEQAIASVNRRSRDHARLPMQWTDEENFGFSKVKPWIACNNRCKDISVEKELADENSVLSHYKRMIELRNRSEFKDVLIYGELCEIKEPDENLIGYSRKLGDMSLNVIVNMSNKSYKSKGISGNINVLIDNYEDAITDGLIRPFEAVVFEELQ